MQLLLYFLFICWYLLLPVLRYIGSYVLYSSQAHVPFSTKISITFSLQFYLQLLRGRNVSFFFQSQVLLIYFHFPWPSFLTNIRGFLQKLKIYFSFHFHAQFLHLIQKYLTQFGAARITSQLLILKCIFTRQLILILWSAPVFLLVSWADFKEPFTCPPFQSLAILLIWVTLPLSTIDTLQILVIINQVSVGSPLWFRTPCLAHADLKARLR